MGLIESIFLLVGSLGFLLYGMRLMSDGVQKSAGERLQRALSMMTGNRFVGVVIVRNHSIHELNLVPMQMGEFYQICLVLVKSPLFTIQYEGMYYAKCKKYCIIHNHENLNRRKNPQSQSCARHFCD